jgi:OOP family OmpA-OmpF porin
MKPTQSTKFLAALGSVFCASLAFAQAPALKPGDAYWKDSSGKTVRDGSGQCVRAGFFTPELASPDCDAGPIARTASSGPLSASAPSAPSQPSASAATTSATPSGSIPQVIPAPQKVTYRADSFFEFDQALLNSAGQRALRDLVTNSKGITLEQILVEGHTDSIGPRDYNQKLSEKRAQAVKSFLVSEGLPANKIRAEGEGELQPVATNTTKEGRAQNRRVTIEVIGSKTAK